MCKLPFQGDGGKWDITTGDVAALVLLAQQFLDE
jgi:hypothetical protein